MELTPIHVMLACGLLGTPGCYVGGDFSPDPVDEDEPGTTDTDDDGPGPSEGCDGTGSVSAPMRRLTGAEYRHSVLDLLGVDPAQVVATFPPDPHIDGFDNNAAAHTIGLAHASAYQAAAEWVAAEVLAEPIGSVGCDPAQPSCLESFIDHTAPLLWRRPLTEPEQDRLRSLAEAGAPGDSAAGLSLVLRAMLQSPHFLWRLETGAQEERTGFDVATELSYFLWQSGPDAELFDRVEAGELDTPQGVAQTARWMWSDPRAARGRAGFTAGWLRSAALGSAVRDPQRYPEWTPALQDAMADELATMVEWFSQGDQDFLDILVSPTLPVSEHTAPIYGVPLPSGSDAVLFDDPWRGGILSTAAVMAATSPGDITSPVSRGVWIREAILCEPLPPPPPDVEADPISSGGDDKSSALEAHRADPACAGCHALVDPIGLGLERYDGVGRLRQLDELGQPPSTAGWIEGLPDSDFEGARALGARLRDAPQTRACLATQMFRWAHGRTETPEDACLIEAAVERFEGSGSLEELAVALVAPTG